MTKPYLDALLAGNEPGGVRDLEARRERARRRDLFAAAALTGLLTDETLMEAVDHEGLLREAWRYADAMLAADPEAQP